MQSLKKQKTKYQKYLFSRRIVPHCGLHSFHNTRRLSWSARFNTSVISATKTHLKFVLHKPSRFLAIRNPRSSILNDIG